jgi:hypothetical protein
MTDDHVSRRELEQAVRFVSDLAMQTSHRAQKIEALALAVLHALIERGELDPAAVEAGLRAGRPSPPPGPAPLAVELAPPGVDNDQVPSPPDLDCAALLPICGARCCMLTFPLSAEDLDAGRLAWSYGQPYHIARGADHRCVHQERATGHCTVYGIRPAVCRSYDCRDDDRIWLDFANKIPAPLDAVLPSPTRRGR